MGYDVHLVKPDVGGQAADQVSDREWQAFRRMHAGVDYVFHTDGKITGKTCVSLMAQ